ncbi:MAG: SanA protein [Verrucomicrobiales bacterium]|jgi:SanA protein
MSTKPAAGISRRRWIAFATGAVLALGVMFFVGCNVWITVSTSRYIKQSADQLSYSDVGIVLGTSRLVEGAPNPHFDHRVEAAAELYNQGKVGVLLVSGFYDKPYYNEPKDMRQALEKLGVPPGAIAEDGKGLRTLDSVARARQHFPYKNTFVVISDGFHVPRAVFIGRQRGLDIGALASREVDYRYSAGSRVRECLARVKAVLDLYVLGTEPAELDSVIPLTADRDASQSDSMSLE